MENLNELKEYGMSLGYEGDALRDFVRDQQIILRDERLAMRQKEKDDQEHKLAMERLVLEKERAKTELQLEREKFENELRLKKLELEMSEAKGRELVTPSSNIPKGPKLPPFEEGKDEIDSYIKRFEVYAVAQK